MLSIGITNVVSTFLDHLLAHFGLPQHIIGLTGAMFQVRFPPFLGIAENIRRCKQQHVHTLTTQAMIMIGSLIVGAIVDR